MADNTPTNAGSGGDTIATDELATINGGATSGVKVQRVKAGFGVDGDLKDVSESSPMPVMLRDDDRTFVQAFVTGVTAGTTATEALVNLTWSTTPGTAGSAANTFVVTAGKRLRITSFVLALRGNATATAAVITGTVRVNTAGAVATTSPALFSLRAATPATALAWDRAQVMLGGEGVEIAGGANVNIGVSVNPVFVTNAPTYDILLTGYFY
jgi:hypothetical protein